MHRIDRLDMLIERYDDPIHLLTDIVKAMSADDADEIFDYIERINGFDIDEE